MTWEEYYDRFYDWAESTQISRLSELTDFGPAEEIMEIAAEFSDAKIVARLLRKAGRAGIRFTLEQIIELSNLVPPDFVPELARLNSTPYTENDLDCLYDFLNDEQIRTLARENRVDYLLPGEAMPAQEPPQKSSGLLDFLAGFFVADAILGGKKKTHGGRCDGDCAHCPPHYGYRYGRWYYGHHHNYGCEFGGNGGL